MSAIVPSILEDNFERFLSKQSAVLKFPNVERIQIDFADGKFTDRTTLTPADLDILNPLYRWEAHMMVEKPLDYLFDLKIVGFSTVIVHLEVLADLAEAQMVASEIRKLKMSPGIAIRPETPVHALREVLRFYDQALLLEVHPGFQRQEMAADTFARIAELRTFSMNAKIEVDGGIKIDHLPKLAEARVDLIVVGSALFDLSGNVLSPTENYEKFQAIALK